MMLRRLTFWSILWAVINLLTVTSMRADELGICSSIVLKPNLTSTPSPREEDLNALGDQLFRRIARHSTVSEPATHIAYRTSPYDGVSLEVAGASCGEATRVAEAIAGGYRIELSVSGQALALDMNSVKRASRGPAGDLEVRLTKEGRDRLREMTSANSGGEMTVRIMRMDGVSLTGTIEILAEIKSGMIQLSRRTLPEDLVDDTSLALPVTVERCVQRCSSSYTWMHDGDRYVYEPEE